MIFTRILVDFDSKIFFFQKTLRIPDFLKSSHLAKKRFFTIYFSDINLA